MRRPAPDLQWGIAGIVVVGLGFLLALVTWVHFPNHAAEARWLYRSLGLILVGILGFLLGVFDAPARISHSRVYKSTHSRSFHARVSTIKSRPQRSSASPQRARREESEKMLAKYIAWCEQRLDFLLRQEKLLVGLVSPVIQGPLTITFKLRLVSPQGQQALNRLLALGPALAQALQVEGVRVAHSTDGVLLEMPSPQPRTPRAHQLLAHTHRLEVALGFDAFRKPVKVDLESHGAVGWVAPSRSGKTSSMKSTLYALLRTNPRQLEFAILAHKLKDWQLFQGCAGYLGLVNQVGEVQQALDWIVERINRAAQGEHHPPLIVVVDDALNLIAQDASITDALASIASMGAGLGVHLLIGSQVASKQGLGGTGVTNNLTVRVLYRPSDSQSGARNSGRGQTQLDQLTSQKGDALVLIGARPQRVATAHVSAADIAQLPRLSGNQAPPWELSAHNRLYPDSARPAKSTNRHEIEPDPIARYADMFPIGHFRPLEPAERAAVRQLKQTGRLTALNKLTKHVYGSRNPARDAEIKKALAERPAPSSRPDGSPWSSTQRLVRLH